MILACYNGECWISEAVESVLNQTYENSELLIINDGYSDNSREVISMYESDKRIRYRFHQNSGFSAANNTGIKNSKGSLVGFIGQNDTWLPNKPKRQGEYLKENRTMGLVHSNLYHINKKEEIIKRRNPKIQNTETLECLFLNNFICFPTALVKRKCIEHINCFDERMAAFSDHDLWLGIAGKFNIGYIDEPLVKKRYHKNQLSKTRKRAAIRDEFLLVRKAIIENLLLEELKKGVKLYYESGVFLLLKGKYEDAKQNFVKATKCHPKEIRIIFASFAPKIYLLLLKYYLWSI